MAELIEHEQRMVAGAVEVAIPGRPFLRAMGRAHRAVHVERNPTQSLGGMVAIDPAARHVGQCREVLWRGQHLGLEPPHLARRGCLMIEGAATHDLTHHRIDG